MAYILEEFTFMLYTSGKLTPVTQDIFPSFRNIHQGKHKKFCILVWFSSFADVMNNGKT